MYQKNIHTKLKRKIESEKSELSRILESVLKISELNRYTPEPAESLAIIHVCQQFTKGDYQPKMPIFG